MLITLIWLIYLGVQKSKVTSGVLIALASLCAFIGFVASCMYALGLKYTSDNSNGFFDGIVKGTGLDYKAVEIGGVSTWIACFGWMIYAVLEFVEYRYSAPTLPK